MISAADLASLYGDDRCTCRHEIKSLGVLYGISFGRGWVRLDDDPGCPHHGSTTPPGRHESWRRPGFPTGCR